MSRVAMSQTPFLQSPSFFLVNLGCKVNRVESDEIAAALIEWGAAEQDASLAQLIVINTCTVTGEAEKKTRKAVRRALRENAKAKVLVTGCAAAISPDTFLAMSERVEVLPKHRLISRACEYLDEIKKDFGPKEAEGEDCHQKEEEGLRLGGNFPTRVGVKVQDGCNNACTFCIVHLARGPAWSRPAKQVIEECVSYVTAGVKEIVLSGINLGSYTYEKEGNSKAAGQGLTRLCLELLQATEGLFTLDERLCRFRVSSVEPRDLDDDFIALLSSAQGRICRHLHLPLQSGSTKVLREMGRPYTADFYVDLVARLRKAVPALSLSTDVIVGFPGETEEDFQATLSLTRACRFSKIHVFPYSLRKGTPAASRTDQVSPEVKERRARELRELGEALRRADYESRLGSEELVLVEEGRRAMSESYYELSLDEDLRRGALVPLKLKAEMIC